MFVVAPITLSLFLMLWTIVGIISVSTIQPYAVFQWVQIAFEFSLPWIEDLYQYISIQSTQMVQLISIGIGIALIGGLAGIIFVTVAATVAAVVTIVMWTIIAILSIVFMTATVIVNGITFILEGAFLAIVYGTTWVLGILGAVAIVYGVLTQ